MSSAAIYRRGWARALLRAALFALLFAALTFSQDGALAQPDSQNNAPAPTATPAPAADSPLLGDEGALRLVNRVSHLSRDYVPKDLVLPAVATRKESLQDNILLRPQAARALEDMFRAALREKAYTLYAVSGYRAYGYQQVLFNQRAEAVGSARASLTVARPGQSEHQLGLAIDIQSNRTLTLSTEFADTDEGRWVADNAHRFGFIIRYKAEWIDITGYSFEPWHLRYVGISHATAIHMLDIPYEHYYDCVIRLPAYVLEMGNPYLLSGVVRSALAGDTRALYVLPLSPDNPHAALEAATRAYLPEDITYRQAVWAGFPTPLPTKAPRVDTDSETELDDLGGW